MNKTTIKSVAAVALVGAALALPVPAEAGNGWAAGLAGFGIGAIVGSALTPREVYVVPPPPPPPVYAPVAYGPPPWSPEWYSYCAARHPSFNAQTGYFYTYSGQPIFCR